MFFISWEYNDIFDWSDRELSSKQSKYWCLLPVGRLPEIQSFDILEISSQK